MKNRFLLLLVALLSTLVFGQNHVLSLDGVDDYVALPGTIIYSGSFTIEAWVMMNGPGGGIEQRSTIFEQRNSQTGCNSSGITYFSETKANERTHRFGLRGSSGCSVGLYYESAEYQEWHHYAAVQNGNHTSIYLDGVLQAALFYDHQGDFSTSIDHASLGSQIHSGDGYGFLFGMMDEVRIWDYALSELDIQNNMNADFSGTEQGLVAYWDFEDSDDEALDKSYNGHNGSFMNGAGRVSVDIIFEEEMWGDYNSDGQINISDVIHLINHILEF